MGKKIVILGMSDTKEERLELEEEFHLIGKVLDMNSIKTETGGQAQVNSPWQP
jgi:hypothetical protein